MLDKLFKRKNAKSPTETWLIEFGEDEDGAFYKITFGEENGALQYKKNYVVGKNIGKANETSALEQAEKEAISRWKKQRDKGYACKNELLPCNQIILPMLAHEYGKHKDKISFPAFVQPKYDGVRCIGSIIDGKGFSLYSRKGKLFNLRHITDTLNNLISDNNITLDGELYTHGVPFQTIISWCKKDQPDTVKLKYRIYDIIDISANYEKRLEILNKIKYNDLIELSPTIKVSSHEEIIEAHSTFVKDGYEGAIVRHGNKPYEINHRSDSLLKVKTFITEEFEIIGYEENTNSPNQCSFILVTNDGYEFKAKPEGTTEYREQLYSDAESLIGKMATIKFFEWTTSKESVPRFPILTCIRDYED